MQAFLLSCSLACSWIGLPAPPIHPIPKIPSRDAEEFHRRHLERHRQACAIWEGHIELLEKRLEFFSEELSPEKASELRQRVESFRDDLEKMKKVERELVRYEKERKLNPGVETDRKAIERLAKLHQELWPIPNVAPMPREVKPNP